jgi:predicted DNA binding CopG/RHH family protein
MNDIKTITVRVPSALYKQTKIKLIQRDVTFQKFILEKLKEFAAGAA